eukprot:scaffold2507_cov122-Isochrysis_galbana.AAC.2
MRKHRGTAAGGLVKGRCACGMAGSTHMSAPTCANIATAPAMPPPSALCPAFLRADQGVADGKRSEREHTKLSPEQSVAPHASVPFGGGARARRELSHRRRHHHGARWAIDALEPKRHELGNAMHSRCTTDGRPPKDAWPHLAAEDQEPDARARPGRRRRCQQQFFPPSCRHGQQIAGDHRLPAFVR